VIKKETRRLLREKRHLRVRRSVSGTRGKPRLSVFKSLRHVYAQVIDDGAGRTLVSACSLEKELADGKEKMNQSQVAAEVGRMIARRAKELGISQVVFDRGGNRYHGNIASLAGAAREEGLEF
jgi:large subunit ribosomal protein L18